MSSFFLKVCHSFDSLETELHVIMLTRYWPISQDSHLQPHSKSKVWQLSTQPQMAYLP